VDCQEASHLGDESCEVCELHKKLALVCRASLEHLGGNFDSFLSCISEVLAVTGKKPSPQGRCLLEYNIDSVYGGGHLARVDGCIDGWFFRCHDGWRFYDRSRRRGRGILWFSGHLLLWFVVYAPLPGAVNEFTRALMSLSDTHLFF